MEHIRINQKIRLEQIKLSMAQAIFEIIDRDREHLRPWLPFVDNTRQVADTEAFISGVLSRNNNKDIIYSIWYNEEFAGLIAYKDTDRVNRKTELGYWLAHKMQGKRIATLCVKTLVKHAFNKQNLNRIQIKVAVNNTRSESIPKKLGFFFEGIERGGELHGNDFKDLKVYSLLKADYLK